MYSSHLTISDRPLPKPLQSPQGELVFNWFLMILVWEDCDPSFASAGRAAAQAVREQSGARHPPVTPWLVADAASGFGTIILQSHGLGRIPLHHFRMMTGITDPSIFRRHHSRRLQPSQLPNAITQRDKQRAGPACKGRAAEVTDTWP